MRNAKSDTPPIEFVAGVAARLGVLLSAGVSQATVWRYLDSDHTDAATATVLAAVRDAPAVALPNAMMQASREMEPRIADAWLALAAAWHVTTVSGAPVASSLRELAASFRELAATQREITVALAGPTATARLVMTLPGVGVVIGVLLGFDTLHTLFGTAVGWVCMTGSSALLFAGVRWNRSLMKKAIPDRASPGFVVDLMAIAMNSGGSIDRARQLVDDACTRLGVLRVEGENEAVESVLDLAHRAGVPAGELLRAEAAQMRRDARSHGQQSAARLGVRLMIPLSVCILPAFMLVGVLPLLLSVLSSTTAPHV